MFNKYPRNIIIFAICYLIASIVGRLASCLNSNIDTFELVVFSIESQVIQMITLFLIPYELSQIKVELSGHF